MKKTSYYDIPLVDENAENTLKHIIKNPLIMLNHKKQKRKHKRR